MNRIDKPTAMFIGHAVGLPLAILSGELLVMNLKKQKLAEKPDKTKVSDLGTLDQNEGPELDEGRQEGGSRVIISH